MHKSTAVYFELILTVLGVTSKSNNILQYCEALLNSYS